jgi:hypothetical protein
MSYGDTTLDWQAGGAVASALGAFMAISAQKADLRARADIADINASAAELAARGALFAGQREEQRSRLATAGLKSAQKTAFAANGVDLGEGSAARTLTSTDVMGEIDANTIAANAVRSAWGYRTQAVNYTNEAVRARSQAGALSPTTAAATSLLTSGGTIAQSWYSLNKAGALDRYASAGGAGTASRNYGRGDL